MITCRSRYAAFTGGAAPSHAEQHRGGQAAVLICSTTHDEPDSKRLRLTMISYSTTKDEINSTTNDKSVILLPTKDELMILLVGTRPSRAERRPCTLN